MSYRILKAGDRLALSFDYDQRLIQLVKSLDGRMYHAKQKIWSIPLAGSEVSLQQLQRWGFELEPKAAEAVKTQQRSDRELEMLAAASDAKIVTSLPLYPYQRVGAAFLQRIGSGLLADDVGLGKTLQSLAVVEQADRVLIVCPAALKYQWAEQIKTFLNEEATVINGNAKQRQLQWQHQSKFTVMNYELLLGDDFNNAMQVPWDYIIADEATKIASHAAKTTKAIKKLRATHRLALSGTPISNRAHEIWSLIDFCRPGVLGGYWQFQQRYCLKDQWGSIIGYQALDELNSKLKRYMIRRTKDQVLPDLPPVVVTNVPVKLSDQERKLYRQIKEELLFEIDQALLNKVSNPVSIQQTIVKMTRLQQLADSMELLGAGTGSAKLDTLKELLTETLAESGRKAIVFTKFAQMANILECELAEYGPLVISGQTHGRYQDVVDQYNNDESKRVLILTSAGQFGLNIQRASVLFHYDQEWSLAKMTQRTGRAHRIGQDKSILEYHLLDKGTIDMYVRRVLHTKAALSEAVLGDNITMQDIRQMLAYEDEKI